MSSQVTTDEPTELGTVGTYKVAHKRVYEPSRITLPWSEKRSNVFPARLSATAVGLCARERHGGPRSDVGPWVRASPPWHSRVGVALHALALEAFVASLFVSPERSVTVTYDGGFANLQDALAAAKAANNEGAATNDGQDLGESAGPTVPAATGLLVASNHVSFLDAPVLGFMLGRAASGVGKK